jgi:hypothetical protein
MRPESPKYLYDIREAIDRIVTFTRDCDFTRYSNDEMRRAAVERQFEIVGEALALRAELDKAMAGGRERGSHAADALDHAIGEVAQMEMKSSEGSLLHEAKLRDHLAYLAADVDLAHARPTPAQAAVFQLLDGQTKVGEQRLRAAITAASRAIAESGAGATH